MRPLSILISFLIISASVSAQPNEYYRSIKEALKNPSQVYNLNLSDAGLKELPEEIKQFPNLKLLNIAGNKITELPDWLFEITSLEILEIGAFTSLPSSDAGYYGNPLKSIPSGIKKLSKLKSLDIAGCPIDVLPDWLGEMKSLGWIGIGGTNIKVVPKSLRNGNKTGERIRLGFDSNQEFDDETETYIKKCVKEFGKSFSKLGRVKMMRTYL